MATIYEPETLPDESSHSPWMNVIPGMRITFHPEGVSFGQVDENDSRFAKVIDYATARCMILNAALENDRTLMRRTIEEML